MYERLWCLMRNHDQRRIFDLRAGIILVVVAIIAAMLYVYFVS